MASACATPIRAPIKVEHPVGVLLITPQDLELVHEAGIRDDATIFREVLQQVLGDQLRLRVVHSPTESLPATVEEQLVMVTGSTHGVNDRHPWLSRQQEFIRRMRDMRKTMLGICHGHQAISDAVGGNVVPGTQGWEFGPTVIELSEAGQRDWLFQGIPPTFTTVNTHQDVIIEASPVSQGPMRPTELAHSRQYPLQAMALGPDIRGVQFHPEQSLEEFRENAPYVLSTLAQRGVHIGSIQRPQIIAPPLDRVQFFRNLIKHALRNAA